MSLSQTTHISALEYSDDESNGQLWGLTLTVWVQIIAVTVLMIALFRFNLVRLWGKTNPYNGQDANWQHSVFVPFIGIYYLYIHREDLFRAAREPARRENSIRLLACLGLVVLGILALGLLQSGETGLPLMLLGVLMGGLVIPAAVPTATSLGTALLLEGLLIFSYGIFPGQNDYVKDMGMVITLFGVATLLAGWSVMKVAWFPIVFLVVALPWPELVYAKLAWPLQKLAASAAVATLRVCGVTAQNYGTRITMFGNKGELRMLNVAEACAGLKSVMTFLMVAGTVAFLSSRPLWEKAVITLSAVPIAIFCNVVRVAGQGILDFYVSHEWSEGFAHQFAGLVMLIPGFFLILLVGWALERLFIEEVDKNKLAQAAANAARSKRMIVEVPRREPAAAPSPTETPTTTSTTPEIAPTPAAEPGTEDASPEDVLLPTPGEPVVPFVAEMAPASSRTAPPGLPKIAPATPAIPAGPRILGGGKPATPAGSSAPAAKLQGARTLGSGSTLKPSSPKPPPAPAATPSSTLKPSAKPPATRGVTPPPAGLKPSTLKPSAPKPRADAPAAPRLKPSAPKPPSKPSGESQ